MGAIALKPGTLRFMRWVPNFSPACQRNTNAQVWVRLWDLGLEYWEAQTLFEITNGIGVPIRIDANTLDRKFGLYERVLVDIDLSTEPPLEIMVEREGGGTLVLEVEYEHLPLSCSHCGNVGHAISSCNWLRPSQAKEVKENDINSRRGRKRSRSRRHRAKKSNVFQVYVAKKVVEVVQQIGDPSSTDPNASSGISRIVHNDMVETSQVPETQLSPLAAPSPRVHSPILGPPSVGGLAGIVAVPTVNAFQALANESETDSEGETTEIQSSDDVQRGADVIIEEDTISKTPSPKELPKDMAQSESDVHKAKSVGVIWKMKNLLVIIHMLRLS
ncbi:uncharacterized protein LOC133737708 [Rosa rugosa]|uniref:uncharacterized protein LOC133737708 n=1 Tax=Rosa rugosa TaxID=74645 RepID=UPI002B40C723|nr:uncharacterized protein LOC133737708 [Rosa rugosa]